MKRILINATHSEETRVAMADGQYLYDLDIEHPNRISRKANIYKGKITRVEPSLEAAFVDYGSDRHGFLPFKEISREYWKTTDKTPARPGIKDVIKEGQSVMVQIDKEERGNKGAALTTFISLAGRFIVLMPNKSSAGGVSKRIVGEARDNVKKLLDTLKAESNMGAIIRTAGVDRDMDELEWDMNYLRTLWNAIQEAYDATKGTALLYQESNLIIRTLRDYFRKDIGEILIDNPRIYQQASEFVKMVMPHNLNKIKLYESDNGTPLFNRFQVENQIESAFHREVTLPSGGAIVIDHTEALTSIDVNSGRATAGHDIEETALNNNVEAAEEIARQLRLRDMGGLVVIDFIDMNNRRNQSTVVKKLSEAVKYDRARIQMSKISKFGLLEMSRQRLRPSLEESSQIACPRCSGQGTIRGVESLALSILRLIEDEAMKDYTVEVQAQVPIKVATYILNEKRVEIAGIQARNNILVTMIPNAYMDTPHYEIMRMRTGDQGEEKSYEVVKKPEDGAAMSPAEADRAQGERPLVNNIQPAAPAPKPKTDAGIMGKFFGLFKGSDASPSSDASEQSGKRSAKSNQSNNSRRKSEGGQQKRGNGNQRNNRNGRNSRDNANDSRKEANASTGRQGKGDKPNARKKPEQKTAGRDNDQAKGRGRQGQAKQDQSKQDQAKQGQSKQGQARPNQSQAKTETAKQDSAPRGRNNQQQGAQTAAQQNATTANANPSNTASDGKQRRGRKPSAASTNARNASTDNNAVVNDTSTQANNAAASAQTQSASAAAKSPAVKTTAAPQREESNTAGGAKFETVESMQKSEVQAQPVEIRIDSNDTSATHASQPIRFESVEGGDQAGDKHAADKNAATKAPAKTKAAAKPASGTAKRSRAASGSTQSANAPAPKVNFEVDYEGIEKAASQKGDAKKTTTTKRRGADAKAETKPTAATEKTVKAPKKAVKAEPKAATTKASDAAKPDATKVDAAKVDEAPVKRKPGRPKKTATSSDASTAAPDKPKATKAKAKAKAPADKAKTDKAPADKKATASTAAVTKKEENTPTDS